MNKDFIFGENSFPLHFHIDGEKIYLYDDVPEGINFTDEQNWLHKKTSYLVDASIAGRKTTIHCGDRHIGTSEAETLNYVSHDFKILKDKNILKIVQENDICRIETFYVEYIKAKVIRIYSRITNISKKTFSLEYISSFAKYDFLSYNAYDKIDFYLPSNSWFLEAQRKKSTLEDLGVVSPNEIKSFKKFSIANTGAWSTKHYLPCAIFNDHIKNNFVMFQIEANGSWQYEFGDYLKNVTLHLSGPTLEENGWNKILKPGKSFETVKVAITSSFTLEKVLKNMTFYRRAIVKGNLDKKEQPVIFNEYMHASWNCPSHQTALELAPTAKKLGADCFVIDCGWHDEVESPFYHVGKWEESKTKYPEGLMKTLDYLRSIGLKVGLWIEMEVVGTLGDARDDYSDDCFFQRNGEVLTISNRYQLDFRNKFVFNKIFKKVDFLVSHYKLDYLKLDYNIEPGIGTSLNSDSLGDGLLEHNRAYQKLVKKLKNKYPNLMIEGCASGGNRLDYLTLSNVNLCSTSDQTDYKIYPYILSNILSVVLPEQAGIWSYPVDSKVDVKSIDDETIIMNMVNSFIGRVHLASKLYLLPQNQQDLISEALTLYKKYNSLRCSSYPYLPLGFSKTHDSVLAYGFRNESKAVLCLYLMNGNKEASLKLKDVKSIKLIYPLNCGDTYKFKNGILNYSASKSCIARIFEVTFK